MEILPGIRFQRIPVCGQRPDLLVHFGDFLPVPLDLAVLLTQFHACLHPADEIVIPEKYDPKQEKTRGYGGITHEPLVLSVQKIFQLSQFAQI